MRGDPGRTRRHPVVGVAMDEAEFSDFRVKKSGEHRWRRVRAIDAKDAIERAYGARVFFYKKKGRIHHFDDLSERYTFYYAYEE